MIRYLNVGWSAPLPGDLAVIGPSDAPSIPRGVDRGPHNRRPEGPNDAVNRSGGPTCPGRSGGEHLDREQGGRDPGVDVHYGEGCAGLEHGVERRLSPPATAVALRGRDPHHGSPDEAGHDGRERTFPSGEDEVDPGALALE